MKDYLQINVFPDLVVVEQEEKPHVLQKKATGRATSKVVRETTGWTRLGLTLRTSTSTSTGPLAAELHCSKCLAVTMQG